MNNPHLIQAVKHYLELHELRHPDYYVKEDLAQLASVNIHGNYNGEIIVSNGVSEHVDEDNVYLKTIINPRDNYILWVENKPDNPLKVGRSFYLPSQTHKHALNNPKGLVHPWIGILVSGPNPTKHYLNLYEHILISAWVQGVEVKEQSKPYCSYLDLMI